MKEVLAILAAWRLTSLLANEDGPFDLLAKFRTLIGVRYDENSRPYGTNTFADAFSCAWCLSVWVGVFFAVLFHKRRLKDFLVTALSLSAGTIILDEAINKNG